MIAIGIGWLFQRRRARAERAGNGEPPPTGRITTVRADRADLVGHYAFPLDRFQLEAIDAIDAGRHVVVAAPTGSGKTVVAEYAIETARRRRAAERSTRRR